MPGDARRLAQEAEAEFDLIVAAGADGTVNEIVNGLASSRPMALLPLGTANVLANEIGLPRRPAELAELIAQGLGQPVWPALVGERLFVAMAGIGFDAETVAAVDPRLKRRFGKLAFAAAAMHCLWRSRQREFVIRTETGSYRAASAILAKGKFCAGGFRLAPRARIADPNLQIVLFRRGDRMAVLRAVAAMAFGMLHRLPEITIVTARSARLDGSGLCHADGEVVAELPLAARIADRPLLLVQPAIIGT